MNPEELRIGNFVQEVDSKTKRPGMVWQHTLDKIVLCMEYSTLELKADKKVNAYTLIEPVPLSDKWYEKLGLKEWYNEIDDGFLGEYYIDIGDGHEPSRYLFVDTLDGEVTIREIDYRLGRNRNTKEFVSQQCMYLCSIGFVHELQNILSSIGK